MKILLLVLLLTCFAFSSTDVQEKVAELDLAYQVEPTEDAFDYYLNFLKGYFVSSDEVSGWELYKQCDGRWANDLIYSQTICQVGCLMTSVSMSLHGLGKTISGAAVTPKNFNAWLKSHGGYSGNLFVWGSGASFGLTYKGQFKEVTSYIGGRHIVILNVNNGGHWVLATGYSNGSFSVLDPGYNRSSYTKGEVVLGAVYAY